MTGEIHKLKVMVISGDSGAKAISVIPAAGGILGEGGEEIVGEGDEEIAGE